MSVEGQQPKNAELDNGKENGNYKDYRDYIEFYWDYIGVILGLYWDYIGIILGLYWGFKSELFRVRLASLCGSDSQC